MIAEGRLETLDAFVLTPRLHASDAKGDTPLHIAARLGNLALCDLFVRSGADAQARNLDGQTPADAAAAEGHGVVARLLGQLSGPGPAGPWDAPAPRALQPAPATRHETRAAPVTARTISPDMLDDLLLEAEEDAESFHRRTAGQAVTGDFIGRITDVGGNAVDGEADWELDLSAAPIRGDGIGETTIHAPDRGRDDDFLRVRSRGRRSRKEAVRPVGTRLHVDPQACRPWAEMAVARGLVTSDDIDDLAGLCDGNGEADDLPARAAPQAAHEAALSTMPTNGLGAG